MRCSTEGATGRGVVPLAAGRDPPGLQLSLSVQTLTTTEEEAEMAAEVTRHAAAAAAMVQRFHPLRT